MVIVENSEDEDVPQLTDIIVPNINETSKTAVNLN
jgi:hypothetical protein